MPLTLECAVATLACARVGAIFTPIFSGYGAGAVAARLEDSGAHAADHRRRLLPAGQAGGHEGGGRRRRRHRAGRRAPAGGARGTGGGRLPWTPRRDVWWHEAVAGQPETYPPAPTAANDPYMIIYTSGTTGRRRGPRHVHAGFPLKAAADQ